MVPNSMRHRCARGGGAVAVCLRARSAGRRARGRARPVEVVGAVRGQRGRVLRLYLVLREVCGSWRWCCASEPVVLG
eukprot:1587776-Heterocapsa_arctica.AAC.1